MSGLIAVQPADVTVLAGFFAAMLLLDAYDVFLPRGHGISMDGPLIGALVALVHSPFVIGLTLIASVAVRVVRGLAKGVWAGATDAAFRTAACAVAYVVAVSAAGSRFEATIIVAVPATYLLSEFLMHQVREALIQRRSVLMMVRSNGSQQLLLIAAQLSTATLTVITQATMGLWILVPVAALLLLMRQAYAMLIELHETYRSTVSILIEAAESQLPELAGHSERTARIARSVGVRCALTSSQVEKVEYAALLHDVDRISVADDTGVNGQSSADVIRDVEFLRGVVPVLDLVDDRRNDLPTDAELMSAFIVVLASAIDNEENGVIDQNESLKRLSSNAPGRVKAAVVGAALELGYSVPAID